MNWRNGLIRLLIIYSVSWVAGVFVAENPLSKPLAPIRVTALGYEHEFPADSNPTEVKLALTQYFAERGITPQGKTPEAAADELVGTYHRWTVWERVQHVVLEAFLLPAALLLAGIAFAWVFAGFRAKAI